MRIRDFLFNRRLPPLSRFLVFPVNKACNPEQLPCRIYANYEVHSNKDIVFFVGIL